MGNIKEFQDHEHTISEVSREETDMENPYGHTENEVDYIMTDKPSMVTDVTVINRINIGSDHRMVMGSITVTIQTDPEEVPPIMAWEVEDALRKMKIGKEAGKDHVNIETLNAGDENRR